VEQMGFETGPEDSPEGADVTCSGSGCHRIVVRLSLCLSVALTQPA